MNKKHAALRNVMENVNAIKILKRESKKLIFLINNTSYIFQNFQDLKNWNSYKRYKLVTFSGD